LPICTALSRFVRLRPPLADLCGLPENVGYVRLGRTFAGRSVCTGLGVRDSLLGIGAAEALTLGWTAEKKIGGEP
jgi:hypothetical protein